MKNLKNTINVLLVCGLFLSSLSASAKKDLPYKDSKLSVDERVDDLLSRMTLEEKFWQMFMIPGDFSDDMSKYKNGVLVFKCPVKENKAMLLSS